MAQARPAIPKTAKVAPRRSLSVARSLRRWTSRLAMRETLSKKSRMSRFVCRSTAASSDSSGSPARGSTPPRPSFVVVVLFSSLWIIRRFRSAAEREPEQRTDADRDQDGLDRMVADEGLELRFGLLRAFLALAQQFAALLLELPDGVGDAVGRERAELLHVAHDLAACIGEVLSGLGLRIDHRSNLLGSSTWSRSMPMRWLPCRSA